MATETKDEKKLDLDKLTDFQKSLYRDYSEDLEAHDGAIEDFDAYEAMHMGKTYDAVSKETKNGLTDSKTATIYLERAARVAGKLPDGEVQAFGKKDFGKGLFMDLLRLKWIYPNANAQRPFRTKMFMLQNGSSEYGYMPIYYDLNVSPSGYYGPDCWIWNPRNFIPQNGFISVSEMDYCHALAYKSPSWFEDLLDEDDESGYKKDEIEKIIAQLKEKTKDTDTKRDTLQVRLKQKQSSRQICVATRYESGKKGRWITFLPDFGYKVIRSIKNPHKNGRIPFVIKPCIPTYDSFYNIGDYQRSMPMQFANDGLDNFYFEGIKINLFPPTVVNAQGVVRHTISQTPGSIWETTGPIPGNVQRLETSTAGLSTYQNAKGMAQGAIQSIAGTTDTRSNADSASDPGFGKTPEALRMISARESTRDGQDREFLEEAMKELIDGMLSLIPIIKEKVPIDMFDKEIEQIIELHPDLVDLFKGAKKSGLVNWRYSDSGNQMRVRIDPAKFAGLEYRFELKPNSTSKKTKEEQLSALVDFFTFIGKLPNALQEYRDATGKVPDWEHIFKTFGDLADVPGFDKAFTTVKQAATPTTEGADTAQDTPTENTLTPEQIAAQGGQPAPAAPTAPVAPPVPAGPVVAPAAPATPGYQFTDPQLAAEAQQLLQLKQAA